MFHSREVDLPSEMPDLTRIDKMSPARQRPLLEAQAVEAADIVAYDTHDADDVWDLHLLELNELLELPLWGKAERRVRRRYAALSDDRLQRAVFQELTHSHLRLLHRAPPRARITTLLSDGVLPPAAYVSLYGYDTREPVRSAAPTGR